MAYFCKDCSYRGKSSGQGGKCPACGSANISAGREKHLRSEGSPRWHKVALVTTWSLLLLLIARKLVP